MPLAFVWAAFLLPGFEAFPDGERGDDQGGDRVGLPPPGPGVQEDAEEGGGGGVGAERGLGRVGDQGSAAQGAAGAPLGDGQGWHDQQGGGGDGQPARAGPGPGAVDQVVDALGSQVGG